MARRLSALDGDTEERVQVQPGAAAMVEDGSRRAEAE